jgi:K+-sensing histidine kinase KdpD
MDALMNLSKKQRDMIIRIVKIAVFSSAIFVTVKLTLELNALTESSAAAFCFLIIVLLSAFFGDIYVAVTTSIIATLCFDYFYLPPVGTFHIDMFADWISLAAFLLTSVIISRLTASAAEHRTRTNILDKTMERMNEFGEWLLSVPRDQLTLSSISGKALNLFSLDYCSIHVYGSGKWRHFTGTASSGIPKEIEEKLEYLHDHPTALSELTEENILGVRLMKINEGDSTLALLAVRSKTLPDIVLGSIAYMIGIRINSEIKSGNI